MNPWVFIGWFVGMVVALIIITLLNLTVGSIGVIYSAVISLVFASLGIVFGYKLSDWAKGH